MLTGIIYDNNNEKQPASTCLNQASC